MPFTSIADLDQLAGDDPAKPVVNLEQVEAGMAWHYKKYQREQSASDRIEYSDAELEARRQKVGLWHDPNPVPPSDYRKAERDRQKSMEPFAGKSTVRGAQ